MVVPPLRTLQKYWDRITCMYGHHYLTIMTLLFQPMQRHLFLYERAILMCKRKEDATGEGKDVYCFKNMLRVGVYYKAAPDRWRKHAEGWGGGGVGQTCCKCSNMLHVYIICMTVCTCTSIKLTYFWYRWFKKSC